MSKHEPSKGRVPNVRVPDTRNYSGKHSKGRLITAIMMGIILISPFAGAVYGFMTA